MSTAKKPEPAAVAQAPVTDRIDMNDPTLSNLEAVEKNLSSVEPAPTQPE